MRRRSEHADSNACRPGVEWERAWRCQGLSLIAGVDEAGRGALAGPVTAAAVVLPVYAEVPPHLKDVADSKLLAAERREQLYQVIVGEAVTYGVASVSSCEIDRIGIVPATRAAMVAAVGALSPQPQALLIDAMDLPELSCPQDAIIKGDRLCLSIAAASILAKVTRDRLMVRMDGQYAGYGLGRHKGYGTVAHLEALAKLGPCEIHRRSYEPVRLLLKRRDADE